MSARILVVDDERNIQMMIRLALQHVGYTVETASDGTEGLRKFGAGDGWDLVLLDQRMPDMPGLEVLREMRKRDSGARVVMITAFGTIDLAVDAMKAGATDFLRKPFTVETLRGAVEAALGRTPGAIAEPEIDILFARPAINGFRVEYHPATGRQVEGEKQHTFTVVGPGAERRECVVCLPAYVVELVLAHTDREEMPGGPRFWQALAEEHLANYLWQYAELPPDGSLRVDDYSTSLRRWVDAVLAGEQEAGHAAPE